MRQLLIHVSLRVLLLVLPPLAAPLSFGCSDKIVTRKEGERRAEADFYENEFHRRRREKREQMEREKLAAATATTTAAAQQK